MPISAWRGGSQPRGLDNSQCYYRITASVTYLSLAVYVYCGMITAVWRSAVTNVTIVFQTMATSVCLADNRMYLPVRSFSACVNSGSRIAPYGPRQVVAGCPIHGVLANYLGLHALSHRRRRSSYCRDVRDCLSRTKRKIKSVFSVLLQLTT